jgi:hypothetical protein
MNDLPETSGPRPLNPAPPDRSSYRASHADREQTATRLRRAAGEGRLAADELERRLEAAFSARTYGELDQLVCDLPTDREPDRRRRVAEFIPVPVTMAITLALAVLVTLVLIAAMVSIGFGRSGAAASSQAHPRIGLGAVGP